MKMLWRKKDDIIIQSASEDTLEEKLPVWVLVSSSRCAFGLLALNDCAAAPAAGCT